LFILCKRLIDEGRSRFSFWRLHSKSFCHVEMNSQRQNLSFVLKPSHSATQLTSLAA
jgi:hypothetical protein